MHYQSLLSSPLLLAGLAHSTPLHPRDDATIEWKACELGLKEAVPFLCGSLTVPLDYTNESNDATIDLDLQKVEALTQPSKGSILLNFGGPGSSGKPDLAYFAPILQIITGGQHDLVNVVPRGTNTTLPFSCFATPEERTLSSLINPIILGNSSNVAPGRIWAETEIFASQCYALQNQTGEFIGTAFTARDYMAVVDALGEDGMLRYWGISYGTLLGATIAAMFPNKIDKMVIDGVVNPHEYYINDEVELFSSSDDVFSGFCTGCVAAPESCPLGINTTASALEEGIYTYLETIKANPVVVPTTSGPFIVDYTFVKSMLFKTLDSPAGWPGFAATLAMLIAGDLEAIGEYFDKAVGGASGIDAEAQFGIKCSDSAQGATDIKEVLPIIEKRHAASRVGGDAADHVTMRCARWPLPAKERYEGDWNVKTKSPVLIIGNTYDPVSPLASAKNVSATFEGSVLLQQNSYGHTSLFQASACTAKIMMGYFANGTLPEANTVCEPDVGVFDGEDGWKGVLEMLAKGE